MPLLELVTYSSLKVQLWEVWWSKARLRDFQKESSHTHSHFQTTMQVRPNAFPYSSKPLGSWFSKCSLILSTVLRASSMNFILLILLLIARVSCLEQVCAIPIDGLIPSPYSSSPPILDIFPPPNSTLILDFFKFSPWILFLSKIKANKEETLGSLMEPLFSMYHPHSREKHWDIVYTLLIKKWVA